MPVYQYEGVHYNLEDGLTNEQAIAKIEAHLGKTKAPEPELGNGDGFLDKAIGLGQAGATAITGAVGGLVGWVPAGLQKLNDPKNVDFEKQYAANMEAMTYEPSRERGQDYANKVGQFTNDVLIPAATGVQGLPYVNTAAPLLGAVGKNLGRFGREARPSGVTSLVEQLKAPEPVKAPEVAPKVEMTPEQTKEANLAAYRKAVAEREARQAAAEQRAKEEQMAQESAFNNYGDVEQIRKQRELEAEQQMNQTLGEQAQPKMDALGEAFKGFDEVGREQNRAKASNMDQQSQFRRMELERQAEENAKAEQAKQQAAAEQRPTEGVTPEQRQAALERDVADRVAAEQREQQRRQAANLDDTPSELHQRWESEKAKYEQAKQAEADKQAAIEKQHQEAVAEQARIAEAQKVLEERQKALSDSMAGVGDSIKRKMRLQAIAEARTAMESASPFSKKHNAFEAKKQALADAEAKKADIARRRQENEALIQKLRDDHTASLERQRIAQEEINKRTEQQRLDMKKQTTLDLSAAERTRQEAGTIPPAVGPLPLGSKARAANKGRGKKSQQNPYGDDVVTMNSGIPITKEHLKMIVKGIEGAGRFVVKLVDGEYKAFLDGQEVGRLASNITPEQSKQLGEKASVDIVKVNDEHKGTGVGRALYEAWNKDHNGEITPSGKTSADAWKLWKRNYPEKVDAFVEQEAARIKDGAPREQVMSNITDPEVAQRVADASKEQPKQGTPRVHPDLAKLGITPEMVDLQKKVREAQIKHNDTLLYGEGRHLGAAQAAIQRPFNKMYRLMEDAGMNPGIVLQAFMKVENVGGLDALGTGTKLPKNFKNQGGFIDLGWGKQEGFKGIPGIKSAVRDIGNALIKTPEEAIKLAGEFADVTKAQANSAINLLTKGGTYLKQKVNNPVVHFTVDRFLKAHGEAAAEVSQKLHNEYLGSLRSLSKQEYKDAFTLLNAADLTQKKITPELMQQHGLSTRLQDFITTHQKLMDDVLGKINTAREAVGKKPITAREAYSAMSMAGDYRKVAYKMIDGEQKVVGVIASNRKTGPIGWSLEKIEKYMLEKDPTLQFGPLKDTTSRTGSQRGTPHEAFQDALATIGENNPHVAEFLNTLKEVAKDDPANYMGMQVHTMQKKGVWGMEGRKPWLDHDANARQFFENQLKYAESAYNWSHLSEAARDVNTVLRDKKVIDKQQNAIRMSEDYMQSALGLNSSRVGRALSEVGNAIGDRSWIGPSDLGLAAGKIRSVANTWLLSLNPTFLGIQLIQAPAAIPAMTALLRGRGLASSSTWLSQGLGHFSQAGITLMKAAVKPDSLTSLEKGALDYAKKNHIYSTDMVEHANQTTRDASYYWTKATQSPAALIESGTRAQTYMTFVKMMDEAGLKPKDGLYEQAHRMTDMAMNNYSALEKPAIYNALGPVGSMAYNLKSFGHNEISRWSMLAREIGNTGNPAPLLTQMASTIVLAGVMGLPFYSQWEQLYDYITDKLGSPRNLTLDVVDASGKLAEKLGKDSEDFRFMMSHGAASYFGADISKRVGLGDVIPSKATDAAFAGGGKAWDMATSPIKFAMKPDEAHARAMAMAWAPPILQSVLKDSWYTKDDKALSMNPDKQTTATATLNERDKLLKSIGITGVNESWQKTRNYELSKLDKTAQDHRDSAMVGITYDMAHGKPFDDALVEKYFVRGEGDVGTFEAALNSAILKMNLDPNQLAMLQDSASKSVTRALSLKRRVENQ